MNVRSLAALLSAVSIDAVAAPGDVLYSNDFETGPAAKDFVAVKGEGRGGSTAWVADAAASNSDWQVQVRWPLKKAKPGMTIAGEFWFKATTNAADWSAGPYPMIFVIWDGPGYSQEIIGKESWLAHVRRGTVGKLETDAEGCLVAVELGRKFEDSS